MNFLNPLLDNYINSYTEVENEILSQLNKETNQKILNPRMISGHLQGRILSMLSHMIKPKYILEIGTYTGYSALCWAEGLNSNGKIHTIDCNEELESIICKYIHKLNLQNQIKLHIGDAQEIILTLDLEWDIVFIDADKENYSNYYDLVFPFVKKGGYIIADNVLWSGKVIDKNINDIDTISIRQYNKKVHSDSRVQNVIFPIRDGLMISRKL